MSITLKVNVVAKSVIRSMRFSPEMSVSEAARDIMEKLGEENLSDHGLFQRAIPGKSPNRFLEPGRTLAFYDLHQDDEVVFRKKTRVQKIKLVDGTIKSIFVDDSKPARDAVETMCSKLDIKNHEEYALQIDGTETWVKGDKCLFEQEITMDSVLVLKKRFFFFDANVDKSDPMQVHVLYSQISEFILNGKYICQKEEAVMLAAFQAQIVYGDFKPEKQKIEKDLLLCLPPQWRQQKKIADDVLVEYKRLAGTPEVNSKYRYIQIARALKTFGMTTFEVKVKVKRDLKDELLGVSRDTIVRMDPETKDVKKTYQLKHVRRFASTDNNVTIDFGDYESEYYNAITKQGREIAALISGYIDITMKIRKDATPILDPSETSQAKVEDIANRSRVPVRRVAAATAVRNTATASSGSGNQMARHAEIQKQARAQDIIVDDVSSALRASELLTEELAAAPSAIVHQTALTPEQWKKQMVVSYEGVASSVGELIKANEEGKPKTASRAAAKALMAHAVKMGTSAKFTTGGEHEDGLSLIDATRNLSNALSTLLRVTEDLQEGADMSKEQRAEWDEAREQYNVSKAYMDAVMSGKGTVDQYSYSLLQSCAQQVAITADQLEFSCAPMADTIPDQAKRTVFLESLAKSNDLGREVELTVEDIGGAVLLPAVRQTLLTKLQLLQKELVTVLETSEGQLSQGDSETLHARKKMVDEAISILLAAMDAAEPSGQVPTECVVEFSQASSELNSFLEQLKQSTGDGPQIIASFRAVAAAVNRAVARSRQIAASSDKKSQDLLAAAKNIADAITKLAQTSKASAEMPEDTQRQMAMVDAADALQSITQTMISDVGRTAAASTVRVRSKALIAKAGKLSLNLRQSEKYIPDSYTSSILTSVQTLNESLRELLTAVKTSAKDPFDNEAQYELVNAAQGASLPALHCVAATNKALTKIQDLEVKQSLQEPSDETRQAAKAILGSCQDYKELGGELVTEEAIEEMAALISEIEASEAEVQTGRLAKLTDKEAHDQAMEMLALATRQLADANETLVDGSGSMDSRSFQTQVRLVSAAVNQAVTAARAAARTTKTKGQSNKILDVAKQLALDMQSLVNASRLHMAKPDDAAAKEALALAAQKVAADLANLTSCDIDSKELDEAAEIIRAEMKKLKITPPPEDTTSQEVADQLANAVKVLIAGVAHVIQMARLNPKGLGPAAKLAAAAVPPVVKSTDHGAGVSEQDQAEQILGNCNQALEQMLNLLLVAKAVAANPADTALEKSLMDSNKHILAALQRLVSSLGSANKEIEEAIRSINEAVERLSNLDSDIESLTVPQAVREMQEAAKKLMEQSQIIVGCARSDPGQLAKNATASAKSVNAIVEKARSLVSKPEPRLPEKYAEASERLRAAIKVLAEGGSTSDATKIIEASKLVAGSSKAMLKIVGDDAATFEGEERGEKLVQAGQQLQSAAGHVARAAKSFFENDPSGAEAVANAAATLEAANERIVAAATVQPGKTESLEDADCERLSTETRAVGVATSQLLFSGMQCSNKPRDKELSSNMSDAAIQLSEAIKALLKSSAGVIEGSENVNQAVEDLHKLVGELASAAMAAAVGSVLMRESSFVQAGMSPESKEQLVSSSKDVQSAIQKMMNAARNSPADVGAAAKELEEAVERVDRIILDGGGAQTDGGKLINSGKDMSDASARLIQAAFAYACNGDKESLAEANRCNAEAAQAVGQIVSRVAKESELLKELEASIARLKKIVDKQAKPPKKVDKEYQDYKDDLTSQLKGLTVGMKNLVAADKANLVQLGDTAKQVAELSKLVNKDAKCAAQLAPNDSVRNDVKAANADLAKATLRILEITKDMAQNPTQASHRQPELTDAFRDATNAVAALTKAAKEGAVGEVKCDEAVDDLKRVVEDLDAALLFSSAGQLEDTTNGQTAAELQKQLLKAAKDLKEAEKKLDNAGSMSPEEVGDASKEVAAASAALAKAVKASASQTSDQSVQQSMLNSGKAAVLAAQALCLAAKDAQRSKAEKSEKVLDSRAETASDSIDALLRTSQTAMLELARGGKALEDARAAVSNNLARMDKMEGNDSATPKSVNDSSRAVLACSSQISNALESNNQEEVVRAAKLMQEACRNLMRDAKGAQKLAENPNDVKALNKAAATMAEDAAKFLKAARDYSAAEPKDKEAKKKEMDEASKSLAEAAPNLTDALKQLPGGEDVDVDAANKEAEELENLAGRELEKAARVIEEAAARLLANKPKSEPKAPGVRLDPKDVNAIIMDGAAAIALATSNLVKYASQAQAKRVANARAGGQRYRSDPMWSNGLISAAQGVVSAVQHLFGAANKDKPTEEELVATAKNVASATAHLVTASKVKADDPNSDDQLALGSSAKAVASATQKLLGAAKTALEQPEEDESATMDLTAVAARNRELEAQIEIEKLEIQLRKARQGMSQIRKQRYAGDEGK